MAEDNFTRFKKKLESGQTKVLAIPPPVPPAGGFLKTAAQVGGRFAKPLVEAGAKKIRELAEGATKEVKPARSKPSRSKPAGGSGKTGGKGRSGTLSEKLESTRTRLRTEKEANKFGPLTVRKDNLPAKQSRAIVKREDNLPATQGGGSRALTVVREGKRDLQPYAAGGRSLATRTFGDKGQSGRIVGLSTKGKLAAGALGLGLGAAGYAAYKKAGSAGAGTPQSNVGMRAADKKEAPRDDRASSLGSQKGDKGGMSADQFRKGRQGQAGINVVTGKKAGDKSILANKPKPSSATGTPAKKMTNFERMKQRQYEKEGYGGRSMTSAGAKARVQKERGYKFSDLFKKK